MPYVIFAFHAYEWQHFFVDCDDSYISICMDIHSVWQISNPSILEGKEIQQIYCDQMKV